MTLGVTGSGDVRTLGATDAANREVFSGVVTAAAGKVKAVRGMTDDLTVGQRVAFYRKRRGLTQLVLAGLVGRTEDWVRKVEHDALPLDRLSVLRRLAYALDVSLGDLIGEPVLLAWSDESGRRTVPALRVALMDHRQFLTSAPPGEPPRLETLAAEIAAQWNDYQNSHYASLTQRLPLLITDVQAACQHHGQDSDEGRRAHELAASAYHVAAAFLTKLGEADLACISASRGLAAAHTSGSDLMIGSLYRSVAHALLAIGEFEQSVALTRAAADYLEPGLADATPEYLSVYGMLHLVGAVASVAWPHTLLETHSVDRCGKASAVRHIHRNCRCGLLALDVAHRDSCLDIEFRARSKPTHDLPPQGETRHNERQPCHQSSHCANVPTVGP